MSAFEPYIALSIFPVVYALGYTFIPQDFLWAMRHGREPMPREMLEARAKAFRRYSNFLGQAMVVGSIAVLAARNSISPSRMGLRLGAWQVSVAVGVAAGLLLVGAQALVVRMASLGPRPPFAYQARRGSAALWVVVYVSGAFAEELWIAFCIVVFLAAGYPAAFAVAATMVVFGWVHGSYGAAGAAAAAVKGTASALLFLWSGSLVPMVLYHFIGNLGSLYWARTRPCAP